MISRGQWSSPVTAGFHDTRSVDTKYLDKKPSDIDLNRHRDPLIDQRIQPNDGSDNDDNFDPRPDSSPERCGISNSGSDIIRSQRVDDRVTHRTFHHVCRLGIGAHGTVDKVQHQLTRELFARKTLRRSHKHPSNITQPSQELEIMIKLKHPNIVEVFAAYFEQSTLNVIMRPVAELNLKEYLNAPQRWPENTQHLGSWLSSLASGLSYIHARNVIHADLKPSNILISSSQAYIADFGTSREFNDDESTTSSICPMTPMYAAPEIVAHQRHGKSADVFSLGCTFAEMITVMAGSSIANLHLHLSKGQNPKRHPGTYSQCLPALRAWMNHLHTCISKPGFWQLTRLCMSMLQKELKARPSARCLVAQLELFSSDRVGTSDIALQIPENILSLRTTVDCPFLRDQRSPQPFKEPVDASSIPEPDQSPGEDYFGVWLSAVSTASFPAYPDLDLIGLGSQMKTAASFPATKTEILNLRPNCLPCALEDDPAFEAADPGYSFTLLDCVSSGIGEFDLRDVDPRADVSRPWWCSLRWASLMRQQQPMQRIECLPHGSTDEELSEFVMFSMKIITPDFTLFGITVTMYDYCARLFKQSGHEQGRCDQNTGTPSVMNSEV
ncbi:hypothetical protein LTR60_002916 [Cryomyces antarcticus]|nr:hypothetical protein LTR60_002916 [Cryomyces antarcticus]